MAGRSDAGHACSGGPPPNLPASGPRACQAAQAAANAVRAAHAVPTLMFPRESNPSNWFTISSIVRCTSLSPRRAWVGREGSEGVKGREREGNRTRDCGDCPGLQRPAGLPRASAQPSCIPGCMLHARRLALWQAALSHCTLPADGAGAAGRARSPPAPSSNRAPPMASTSSKKMMHAFLDRAIWNSSRT